MILIIVIVTGIFIREFENGGYPMKSRTTSEIVPVHKKIVKQIFSKISENLPILGYFNVSNKPIIHFILPLSGRFNVFQRFLKLFEDVCVKEQEAANLYVILYKNEKSPEDYDRTTSLVEELNTKYRSNTVRIINSNETFSRGKALQHGVNLLENDDLILFIDVDIVFNKNSLERIRKNTIQLRSIYFPVVYSLYNPKLLHKFYNNSDYTEFLSDIIDESNGFWRQFGFGIVSLYKSDYKTLGGFDLQISGWGYEDVTFFDNAVKSNLKIVRAVDPNIIHVFHPVQCESTLEVQQQTMCLGTKASTLGSLGELQKLLVKYKDLFR